MGTHILSMSLITYEEGEAIQAHAEQMEDRMEELQQRLAIALQVIEERELKIASLTSDVEMQRSVARAAEGANVELERSLERRNAENTQLTAEVTSLRSQLAAANTRAARAVEKLTAVKHKAKPLIDLMAKHPNAGQGLVS